jgi:hypothetical protein
MRARSANACGAPCLRVSAVNSIFSAASSTIATARPFAIPASLRHRRENVNDLSIMTLAACRTEGYRMIAADGFSGPNVHWMSDQVPSALFRSSSTLRLGVLACV